MAKRNKHIGSSLDSLLEETGDLAETRARAIKGVTAWETDQKPEADETANMDEDTSVERFERKNLTALREALLKAERSGRSNRTPQEIKDSVIRRFDPEHK